MSQGSVSHAFSQLDVGFFVDEVFRTEYGSRDLLQELKVRNKRLSDFDQVVEIVRPRGIGGSYGRGQAFPTFGELYDSLNGDERSQLKEFYLQQVQQAEQKFLQLKKDFPFQLGN